MSNATHTALLALGAGSLSAGLTWALVRFSARLGMTAAPRADRWHRRPTPNTGGIAAFLACAALYGLAFRGQHAAVAAGAVLIWLAGFLDDRRQLRPGAKFAVQSAAALGLVASGVVFTATPWPALNIAFSFLWIVGITNAFNLIDNMDGLCAGATVIICGFRFWLLAAQGHWMDANLCAVLGAAYAGFLLWNYHPARIFLGDCGSMLAGFLLASLTLASPLPHTKVLLAGIFYPALTFAYPIFDTLLVSVLRKAAGRPITVGGRDHSSHRLASLGLGERKVVWIVWGLTAAGSAAGVMVHWMPVPVIAAAALLTAGITIFGIFLATLPAYPSPRDSVLLASSRVRARIPTLRAGITLVVDTLTASLALFVAYLARFELEPPPEQIRNLLFSLPVVMGVHCALCSMLRSYNVPWRWFGLRDAALFARVAALGSAVSFFALWCSGIGSASRGVALIYALACFVLSVAMRASLRLLGELLRAPENGRPKIAIFGANAEGETLAALLDKHPIVDGAPVAFLDFDETKRGLRIAGIPVCHCNSDLKQLCARLGVSMVVAPGQSLGPPEWGRLEQECAGAGLELLALDIAVRRVAGGTGASARPALDGR